jgi:hypothetical protein
MPQLPCRGHRVWRNEIGWSSAAAESVRGFLSGVVMDRGNFGQPMSAAELAAAGELLFGSMWRSRLAKVLDVSDRMIRFYESGERRISPAIAAKVRHLVDIGPAGTVVRATIRRIDPHIPLFTAHLMAKQILVDLASLGMLGNCKSSDAKEAVLS